MTLPTPDTTLMPLGPGGPDWLVAPLEEALGALETATKEIQAGFRDNPNDAAYGCCDYLRAFSLVALGEAWLRSVRAAEGHKDAGFAEAKVVTATAAPATGWRRTTFRPRWGAFSGVTFIDFLRRSRPGRDIPDL